MKQTILRILAALSALAVCALALADQPHGKDAYFVSGIVRDAVTMEPLPFASVTITGKATGTLTNDNGIFEITVPNDASEMAVSCLGYEKATMPIRKRTINLYEVLMQPVATELKEVVVHRKKYSKKNNPAVDFAQSLRGMGPATDPERNDYYGYDKYQIITMAINDFANRDENSSLFKRFPFLWDHVDTSEVSGKPILNFMVKEKASEVNYRHTPKARKETVKGLRQEGVDEILDQGNMLTMLEDVLREIDLYDNDINILQNRFVSPLSRIAPDFYKFYLTDTVEVAGERCIVLSFYPRNQASFGFNGQVYVPANDSTMFIKKVVMRAPRNINLNFIQNLYISQEFDRAADGSRLKTRDDMTIEMRIMSGTPGLYLRRNVAYANHNFDAPADLAVFDALETEIVGTDAKTQDEAFWDEARLIEITDNELNVSNLFDKLRQVPFYYWTEKFLKIMFMGYVNTGNPSKFDYGPVNTTVSRNTAEGWRFRAGGMTTANLSPHWFARGYVAYGTTDRKWKYRGEVEYSFTPKEYHSREFPVHSLRASSMYDIDQLGQHYMFTNADNMFLSFKRLPDTQVTYHHVNQLEYTIELRNNFSVLTTLKNEKQEASRYIKFVDGYGSTFRDYSETSLQLQLRFAPGEKYYQTKSARIPINFDAPIVMLTHTIAPKGWLGSKYMINTTEASFQKRFWLSAFGYTDIILKGGHVWSRSPFPNLLIPNANLSYTIQPESYALMNPMEFINDSYASIDFTYWANGAILNNIPLVKKLKMREVFAFRSLWGNLSDRNDPAKHPELLQFPLTATTKMTDRPYMEISAGLDNIFKCLRIDYVWRLSYLDVPYDIDRRGLRIALHATF